VKGDGHGAAVVGTIASDPLEVAGLTGLMGVTAGASDIGVALIDGPVVTDRPDLAAENIRSLSPAIGGANRAATAHGTYVAGILAARRGSRAPAICPGCTLLVRPIFLGTASDNAEMPRAAPDEVADAVAHCVDAGAQVVNLSVAIAPPSPNKEQNLEEALSYAARRGAIVVAAAGNQGTIGSSALTRHAWVIPVAACDLRGRPIGPSNLGASIGRHGLRAPGEAITSLGTQGEPVTSGGTSAATAFVTGAVALLWSIFPAATAAEIKRAISQADITGRTTIVPPLLNAWAAYQAIASSYSGRTTE
jgi:subtilisin family serine protease